ncbi:MAG TPA: site-2 protease family protein [Candidatus Eremiobacteraeota bacterium]|nr:MAG: Peptidase family M50 [bacterium ADurb.Bin363]HPZ07354.1 site-2 protease family protein [Candidatus Eremiobacteraeota bacterium]
MEKIILIIMLFPILLLSLIIHEIAHGRMAFFRGDPSALYENRLSFNPLVHLDKTGTIVMASTLLFSIIATTVTNFILCLGWAKPVPVREENLDNPKIDIILVSLAGPVSNFIIAFLAGLPFQIGLLRVPSSFSSEGLVSMFLYLIVNVNIVLAIFNLLPLPPLDGSKILASFLPEKYQDTLKYPTRNVLIVTIILTILLISLPGFSGLIGFLIKLFTSIGSM